MCFFFYGTLLDRDVRRAVLGPWADSVTLKPARLEGWQRVRLAGRVYPVVVQRRGKTVGGCILRGLPVSVVVRLRRFEGPEYRLARIEVTTEAGERLTARAFVGSGTVSATSVCWSFENWTRRHKAALLRQLRRSC